MSEPLQYCCEEHSHEGFSPCPKCYPPSALPAPVGSVTAVDGYRAAAIIVDKFLNAAEKDRPKRGGHGDRRRAAFREGYYHGLLFAHSMNAFGQFPESNIEPIRTILSQNAPHEPRGANHSDDKSANQ